MIDLLQIPDFLDAATCQTLQAELRSVEGGSATVSGQTPDRSVQLQVRRTTRAAVPPAVSERMTRLLMACKPALEGHFALALTSCESPHFLRYQPGDFFVAHQDGNTPLVFDDTRFRKVSAVIFLSRHSEDALPNSYGGGALVLHGPYAGPPLRVPLTPAPGTLVAFRAETTHEVTPVTHGERLTIVSWYR